MQTQLQQMSKKNKVTVPFYSPPSRLYGQTPAEIIKEARAAVMNTSAVGIKPVFTNRPFTPKEKERTLFGNVKKRSGRPPSSFSLRNLQSQEPGSRVKLPSIEVVSRRKTYATHHYSHNLSLDNLTEDSAAETLEEIKEIDSEKLPKWQKSHSCPKEGRMVKASSFNELSHRWFGEYNKDSGGDEENKTDEELMRINLQKTKPRKDSDSAASAASGDDSKSGQQDCQLSSYTRFLNMTRGGGDYEVASFEETPKNVTQDLQKKTNDYEIASYEETPKNVTKDLQKEIDSPASSNEKGPNVEKILDKERIKTPEKKPEELKEKKQPKQKEFTAEPETLIKKETVKAISEGEKNLNKSAEKSIATEPKSEYLTALKDGYKTSYPVKQNESVPLEILQLYETARYYGVDVDDTSQPSSNSIAKPTGKNIEDYFGENPNDYLNHLKEQSHNIEEKMKILNKEINKKVSPRTEKQTAKTPTEDNVRFVMNNKTRYHVVGEKGNDKEKAYEKWNNKQQANGPDPQPQTSNGSSDLFWKNSYFRSKEEDEVSSEKTKERVKRLVNRISGFIKIGAEDSDIIENTSQLYNIIKNQQVSLDNNFKSNILKAMYLYADNENPQVLLSLAKILLYLKVDSSLPVAFKIIFKVARFDSNDYLFLNEDDILELFLDGIGRSSPLDSAESCIYGYGALKFLTMNHNILSRILHLGALDLMTLHLKMINTAHAEKGSVGEQTQHALFQLTGALRHVAAGEGALPLFLTTNCIIIICKTLQLFHKDDDVVTNISRTLSLLSADESVTQVLMTVENILTTVIDLIDRYKENDKILIRLAYCLGNIVEHSDLARVQLSRSDASLTVLLNTLKLYINKDLEISMKENNGQSPEELNAETIDDIIVKVIRIIANMSMNPIVGSNLSPATNEKKSLQLSKLLSLLLMRKDPGITLLATLGCLNNISYYCNTHSVLIDITQGVERVLGLPSEDCQAEAARVLGNLTRHKEIRDLIYNTGGVNQLIKLLASQDQEVVKCACGALVNMMLDSDTRKHFLEAQGIDKLVQALEQFSGDWSLASLAARAIWNSCADDLSSAVSNNNVENLLNILANSLEEENWNDGDAAWEEFASIATDLLERINSHLEST